LNITILQGSKEEEKKINSIILNNYNENYGNIFLMHNYNGYSIIYTAEFLECIKNFKIEDKFLENPINHPERYTIVKGKKCVNCNKQKKTIKFIHFEDFVICKSCVRKYINNLILKRVKDFIKENLRNKECKYDTLYFKNRLLPTNNL